MIKISWLLVFCFCSLAAYAQNVTGLWEGILYNDSTGKNYVYDLALTYNGNKIEGYSRTGFIKDDVQYFNIKAVTAKIINGKVLIKDEGTISNNYPGTLPKGVYQLNVLQWAAAANDTSLVGEFSTNATKKYSPVTGLVKLIKKSGAEQSSILPHLQELGLASKFPYLPQQAVATVTSKNIVPTATQPTTAIPVKPRNIEVQQTIMFSADSLYLSLYDNGEIDGDTITVSVNNTIVFSRLGLLSRPAKITLAVSALPDSFLITLYAETMGSIPPNTGLLIVQEAGKRTEVRFSGDYTKTAAILFKRKKLSP